MRSVFPMFFFIRVGVLVGGKLRNLATTVCDQSYTLNSQTTSPELFHSEGLHKQSLPSFGIKHCQQTKALYLWLIQQLQAFNACSTLNIQPIHASCQSIEGNLLTAAVKVTLL